MKMLLTSLAIRKKIKQRIRYYFTTFNLQSLKSQTILSVRKDVKQRPLSHVDANAFGYSDPEEQFGKLPG